MVQAAESGTDVGRQVAASDPDGDTLTYTLGETDAESFDIDSTTGQLNTKTALDTATKSSYSVTVSVTDGKNAGGGRDPTQDDTITVTITVTITITIIFRVPGHRTGCPGRVGPLGGKPDGD